MTPRSREPLAWLSRPIAGRTLPARAAELVRATLDRLVAIQFVDRAVALGSLAFTALVPLLVIAGAFLPGGRGVAETLIDRFRLDGATARLVEDVFTTPETTRGAISVVGAALLIGSALSLTRALQRLYEQAWRLGARGWGGTVAGLEWLAIVVVWATLFAAVRDQLVAETGAVVALAVALGGSAVLWLLTPYVLLAQRVPWRRLVPTAVLSAGGMTALGVGSVIYMPEAIADSADRYGPIGIAIALVSWLVGTGFVIVVCAALGAVLGGATGAPPSPPSPPSPPRLSPALRPPEAG